MTLPQRNTALERPTNFYYLMCKLDRAQYPDTTEVVYGEHILRKARVHVILDLYGRYALSSNISDTETSSAVIETFNRAFAVEPDAHPMIHTDRGAAY